MFSIFYFKKFYITFFFRRDDNIVEEERTIDDPKGVEEVERAQDEQSNEATDAGTEETSMPVPQIKIGPSGEIILDEQSLVFHNIHLHVHIF